MFRFVAHERGICAAGEMEAQPGSIQPQSLYAEDSTFMKGRLYAAGQDFSEEAEMIRDSGFRMAGMIQD